MNKGFLILVGIIFVAGLIYLNGQVADACTHGNCVHGWDSKYTKTEQANYRLWFFGFPITIYILYKFFNSDNQNNRSYQEKVDYSEPKRVVKTKKKINENKDSNYQNLNKERVIKKNDRVRDAVDYFFNFSMYSLSKNISSLSSISEAEKFKFRQNYIKENNIHDYGVMYFSRIEIESISFTIYHLKQNSSFKISQCCEPSLDYTSPIVKEVHGYLSKII